jgi:hypothetical protein
MPTPSSGASAQHFSIVAAETPADGDPHLTAFTNEAPFFAPGQQAGAETVTSGELTRLSRHSTLLPVGRCSTRDEPGRRELADDQR